MMTGVVEEGRAAYRRRAWRDVYVLLSEACRDATLAIEDLERLAVAGYLIGADDGADLWARAYQECLRVGDVAGAARCAFWLAFGLLDGAEVARAGGWLVKAEKLINESGSDCAVRGYLLIPAAMARFADSPAAALECFVAACQIGERFADVGLATLGRMGQGQALIALGAWADATLVLDEAIVAVIADEVPPIVAGLVLCGAIDACKGLFDLQRAREWTAVLSRWCDSQSDLVPFRGQCRVHRAEIMQLGGDWPDAMAEADRACRLLSGRAAYGDAMYQVAELHRLRGDLAEAEGAYRAASQAGREPQPGMALLRLAQGHVQLAVAAIGRVVGEAMNDAARSRVLGPFVEIMLASGDVGAARVGADELGVLAARIDVVFLRAVAANASGAVLLKEGDPASALPLLRQALAVWRRLELPYETARVRVLIGLACRAMGDQDSANMELDAARLGFQVLGAAGEEARLKTLLSLERTSRQVLTSREVEVVRLVAEGKSNREIAALLVISEHTVARHLQNVFTKLGVSSRTAASLYAHKHGLV
jgi:DNA-binding CsgD family transcriptional regulator